jgi:hypothetical protein
VVGPERDGSGNAVGRGPGVRRRKIHKIEPRELGNASADSIFAALPESFAAFLDNEIPTLFAIE